MTADFNVGSEKNAVSIFVLLGLVIILIVSLLNKSKLSVNQFAIVVHLEARIVLFEQALQHFALV